MKYLGIIFLLSRRFALFTEWIVLVLWKWCKDFKTKIWQQPLRQLAWLHRILSCLHSNPLKIVAGPWRSVGPSSNYAAPMLRLGSRQGKDRLFCLLFNLLFSMRVCLLGRLFFRVPFTANGLITFDASMLVLMFTPLATSVVCVIIIWEEEHEFKNLFNAFNYVSFTFASRFYGGRVNLLEVYGPKQWFTRLAIGGHVLCLFGAPIFALLTLGGYPHSPLMLQGTLRDLIGDSQIIDLKKHELLLVIVDWILTTAVVFQLLFISLTLSEAIIQAKMALHTLRSVAVVKCDEQELNRQVTSVELMFNRFYVVSRYLAPMALLAGWTVSVIAAVGFINIHSYGVQVGKSYLFLRVLGFIFCITFGIVSICKKVAEGLATESDKCLTELKRKVWGKGLKTGQTRRHVAVLRRNSTWGSIRQNRRTIRCPVWFSLKYRRAY